MRQSDHPQYLFLLDALAGNLRFYRLHCNMDPEAARVSFGAISQEICVSRFLKAGAFGTEELRQEQETPRIGTGCGE